MPLDESGLRALLDDRGLLVASRPHLLPSHEAAFVVFSQRRDARIDIGEWGRHAERFVGTRIGLTVEKRYGDADAPSHDVARLALAPAPKETFEGGARVCWGRPRTEDDLRAARDSESAGAGLLELAARCPQVWLVEGTEDDLLALRLAVIVAGVALGPILTPGERALLGPKTARERLNAARG